MRDEYVDVGVLRFSRWIFNCYVIEDGGAGQPVVVDVGITSNGVASAEHFAGRRLDDPLTVLATHAHSDHVSGLMALADRTAVQLHLPVKDRDYFAGEKPRTPTMKVAARIMPVIRDARFSFRALSEFLSGGRHAGFGSSSPFQMPLQAASYLTDGDPVPGAPDWVIIHTPGHTDDSTSFYNEASRTLFSGDAVLTVKGRPWFTPEFVDETLMARTEDKLRKLRVDHLFPGHGHPVHGQDVLSDAIPHLEKP
ncbi:MAG: MBL fold metallo-hydrolase [Candidatus Nanopelagicales bacterium]|nr:MBL fold metallo-hydrolase [Candidatus Nanopelagicales bacterium]